MKRIIDANLNRATEGLRVLEEITRFFLDDENLTNELKQIRHKICSNFDFDYENLLNSRDAQNDVGVGLENPTERKGIETVFKANIKRLQQALRVLAECGELSEELRYKSYTLEKRIYERLKMNLKKYMLEGKKLYLVTNSDNFNSDDEFLDCIASALKGGVGIVQLREKNAPAKRIIELSKKIRDLTSLFNAVFIVNDRIDIAKIVSADGVHLGQDDVDIEFAREILGESAIIGISTHSPLQAQKAIEKGADYIGVGPVFSTPTKKNATPVGLEYVKWASENVKIPFYAIGGINLENLNEVIRNGAKGVAVVREIMNSKNPQKTSEEIIEMIKTNS